MSALFGPAVHGPPQRARTAPGDVATPAAMSLHEAFRMEVSIREMKNRLSKYLKLARTDNDVVITDRGKPFARLTLVEPTAKDEEAQAIRRINALPWVRPGKGGKPKGARNPIPWKPGDKLASDRVIEDRN